MPTASTPYFSGDYAAAILALGEDCPYRPQDFDARRPEVHGVPALIAHALRHTDKPRVTWRMLQSRAAKYGARKALETIGIHCEDHLVPMEPETQLSIISATVDAETVPEAPDAFVEPFDDKDDIHDPPVPPGVSGATGGPPSAMSPTVPVLPDAFLPMAHGFCQYLQAVMEQKMEESGRHLMKDLGVTLDGLTQYITGVLRERHDSAAAITVPYQMTLQVTTPQGFPLTLTVTKTSAEELIGALGKLDGWLTQNGYTVPE